MARFEIEANGKRYEVEAPDMQAAMTALRGGGQSGPDFSQTAPMTNRPQLQTALDNKAAGGSWVDPLAQGLTLGFGDEILGGAMGLAAMAKGRSFSEGYDPTVKRLRGSLAAERQRHPVRSAALEVAGSVPSALVPVGKLAQGASLGPRMWQGAKAGATLGGIYGVGASEGGLQDRLTGGTFGAVTGGATGAAFPLIASGVRAVASPFVNAVKARVNPSGYAAQKVADSLASQGRGADQAAARMSQAASQGQRMALADVGGKDAQDLARVAVNIPGPARNRITAKVNIAQMGQGERLKGAIRDLFADPNAYQATKEQMIAARAKAAAPYYKIAESKPIPYTFGIEEILNTPAGRAGLAAAKQNSLNRREPWAQWFASIDDAGNIIDKRRVPDTRALDEVQRVLRAMAEDAKAPADGSPFAKARATPKSIAIQSVHDDLLKAMDAANPAYKTARGIALDNIQADQALEFGRNSLGMDARVIAKEMGKLTPAQQELARVGHAEALRDKIDKTGYTHNAVARVFNTRNQLAQTRAMFGTTAEFNKFRSFIFNEARRTQTRAAVTGNSTTARQLADMGAANQMGETASIAGNMVAGNHGGAIMQTLQAGLRRAGGLTPKVAEEIGRLLMTSDPAVARGIVAQIRSIENSNISAAARNAAIRSVLTRLVAAQEGRTSAQQPNIPLVAR